MEMFGRVKIITESSADPDGKTGSYFYQWQRSDDGRTWNNFANANSTYTISESDQGKNIRALISYTDGLGFTEQVITTPLTIPVPISVNTPDETAGAISLAKDSDGYAYAALKDTEDWIPLSDSRGVPIGDNTWAGWSVIGAEKP